MHTILMLLRNSKTSPEPMKSSQIPKNANYMINMARKASSREEEAAV
jgi:hypothetical protein